MIGYMICAFIISLAWITCYLGIYVVEGDWKFGPEADTALGSSFSVGLIALTITVIVLFLSGFATFASGSVVFLSFTPLAGIFIGKYIKNIGRKISKLLDILKDDE